MRTAQRGRPVSARAEAARLDASGRYPLLAGLRTSWHQLPLVLVVGCALTAALALWGLAVWLGGPVGAALGGLPVLPLWAWAAERVHAALAASDAPGRGPGPARRRDWWWRVLGTGLPAVLAGSTLLLAWTSTTPVPPLLLAVAVAVCLLATWVVHTAYLQDVRRPGSLLDRWRAAAGRAGTRPAEAVGLMLLLALAGWAAWVWSPLVLPVALGVLLVLASAVLDPRP